MDLKSIIESILFVNEKPLPAQEISTALDLERSEVVNAIEELKNDYEKRHAGLCVVKVAGGYQLCSSPDNSSWVRKLYKKKFRRRLSPASLEILAITAYKQPITKLEIESIRGVNCDQVIRSLANLGLIKVKGRKDVIGKPFVYGTTRKFLEYFGLNSLNDLPALENTDEYKVGLNAAGITADEDGEEGSEYEDEQEVPSTEEKENTNETEEVERQD